ncbi:MAG: ribonuclease HI [Patescibacteria group bacterium]
MNNIVVFTDGSARGNPGPGGWAAIIASDNNVMELGGRENNTTNNRMELKAVYQALARIHTVKQTGSNVTVYSDSAYVINGITSWIHGWKRSEWITSTKQPVEHRDLWEAIDELIQGLNITWVRLSGHAGLPGNERCDEIATSLADKENITLYNGTRAEYDIDLSRVTVEKGSTVAKKKKSRSSEKAYSYVSSVGGKTMTHATWAECEKRVKGTAGARFKKVFNSAEEEALIEEWRGK